MGARRPQPSSIPVYTQPAYRVWRAVPRLLAHLDGLPPMALLWAAGMAGVTAYALLVLLPLRLDRHPPDPGFSVGETFGQSWAGAGRFVLMMAVFATVYGAGVQATRRLGGRGAAAALALAALFQAMLVPAHPWYSRDVFHYIATARIFYVHGANPLIVPPRAFPDDPLARLPDWDWLPSPYGPVWVLLQALPSALARGADQPVLYLVGFKTLAAGAVLATAWLIGDIAERLQPDSRTLGIVLFAWNPLTVLHSAGDGHNDATMLCLLLLGLWLAVRARPIWASLALTLATLIKFVPLAVLPLLLGWLLRSPDFRPRRWRAMIAVVAVSATTVVGAYLPFWEGPRTLRASFDEGSYLTTSIYAVFGSLLRSVWPARLLDPLLTMGPRLLFLPVLAVLTWRMRGDVGHLVEQTATAFLILVLVATPWFMPWYTLWPLALAAAVPSRSRTATLAVALTMGALLLPVATGFLMVLSGQGTAWRPLHAVATALTLGPVGLAALAHRLRSAAHAMDSERHPRVPLAGD